MACRNYLDHRNLLADHLPERLARVNDGSITARQRLAEVLGTSVAPERQVERLGSRSHKRAAPCCSRSTNSRASGSVDCGIEARSALGLLEFLGFQP